MFEFHGWAVIRSRYGATEEDDKASDHELGPLLEGLRQQIAAARTARHFHLQPEINGMVTLTVSGLGNHREAEVIEVFAWLAAHGPGSYGLLYVLDDEDRRGEEYTLNFRVFRLARGLLQEMDDPFLSPIIPVVED